MLFVPGIANVVITIATVFAKIIMAIKDHDPELDSTLELSLKPVSIVVEIIKGGIMMMHGYCVLSGIHGPVRIRRPMYLVITVFLFSVYSICWLVLSVVSTLTGARVLDMDCGNDKVRSKSCVRR